MSAPATTPKRPPVRWRPRPLPIATVGVVAFVGLSGFIGVRMAAGQDPALGAGSPAAVVTVYRAKTLGADAASSTPVDSSSDASVQVTPAPAQQSAPVQQAAPVQQSAPVQQAAAPAQQVAPAQQSAPAPTTSSSGG